MLGLFTFTFGLLAAISPAVALPALPRDNLPHSLPNPKAPHSFIAVAENPISYWVSTGAAIYVPGGTPPSSSMTSEVQLTATSLAQPAVVGRAYIAVPSRNVSPRSPASQDPSQHPSLPRPRSIPMAPPVHDLGERKLSEGGEANARGMRRELRTSTTKGASEPGGVESESARP